MACSIVGTRCDLQSMVGSSREGRALQGFLTPGDVVDEAG
jgi:hypothetical protein